MRRKSWGRPDGLPLISARLARLQQNRLMSTLPTMPGSEPVVVYCQNIHDVHPPGRGRGSGAVVQRAIHSR